jgi:hypothetical protein
MGDAKCQSWEVPPMVLLSLLRKLALRARVLHEPQDFSVHAVPGVMVGPPG